MIYVSAELCRSDEKIDHSVPKSRSARFVRYSSCYISPQLNSISVYQPLDSYRTSSGRYIRKNSKDHGGGMGGPHGGLERDGDPHV